MSSSKVVHEMREDASMPSPDSVSDDDACENGPLNPPAAPPMISPSLFLLGASFPFALGAYGGYRREMKRAAAAGGDNYTPGSGGATGGGGGIISRLMEGHELPSAGKAKAPTSAAASASAAEASGAATAATAAAGRAGATGFNPAGPVLAARALLIGSMLSVGGVGILSAALFYASGYESIDEAVRSLREWGPRKRREMERLMGLPEGGVSASHPDIVATKGMSEDDELDYVKRKYMAELYEDEDDDGNEGNEDK